VSRILDNVETEKRARSGKRGPTIVLAAGVLAAATLAGLTASTGQPSSASTVPTSSVPASSAKYHLISSVHHATAAGTPSGITGGALFGGTYSLLNEEPSLGRKLAVVRIYMFIGDSFPGNKYASVLSGGRTVLVNLDSQKDSYASIAAGEHDTSISSFLQEVNQAAIKYNLPAIYFSFQHEPDSDHHRFLGSPAQFVQAWDHVHALAESMHLDWNDGGRLHWVLILIHNTYSNGRVNMFWPGASEVDLIAADGYNSAGCRAAAQSLGKAVKPGSITEATPASLFNPVVKYAAAHGNIPVFIAEWGSDTIPSGAQPAFIQQMQAYVAATPSIVAVSYWNLKQATCNYQVNGDPTSIADLATMGASSALQGHLIG
jgi:hypothetical protein